MKINKYIVFAVFLLIIAQIVSIVVKEYEINDYKSQIEDLRQNIRYYNLKDSILGVQIDSLGRTYYVIYEDDNGNHMTYKKMMETIEAQERVITVQDVVIQTAKEYFKFNYAVKDSGGFIRTRFWRKDGKKIE